MSTDRLINVLVTITLIEMMWAIGLGLSVADLLSFVGRWRLVFQGLVANYLVVPVATAALLLGDEQTQAGQPS